MAKENQHAKTTAQSKTGQTRQNRNAGKRTAKASVRPVQSRAKRTTGTTSQQWGTRGTTTYKAPTYKSTGKPVPKDCYDCEDCKPESLEYYFRNLDYERSAGIVDLLVIISVIGLIGYVVWYGVQVVRL